MNRSSFIPQSGRKSEKVGDKIWVKSIRHESHDLGVLQEQFPLFTSLSPLIPDSCLGNWNVIAGLLTDFYSIAEVAVSLV